MIILFSILLLILPFASQPEETLNNAIGHFNNGDYGQAIELLSQDGTTGADSAEIKFWLGRSYLKIRKWDEAVDEMEKAVKTKPSNAMYHLWLGRAYGARADNRIFGYNDARRLLREFKKANELAPDNTEIRFDLLEFYIQAPGIVGGSKDKAWEEAEAIAKLNPKLGYTARATIYERKKKWDLARKEYEQAVLDHPDNADSHKDLAQFLFNRKDHKGALKSAIRVLKLKHDSRQGLFIASASRAHLGIELEKAEADLKTLATGGQGQENPSLEEIYYWLGVLYNSKEEKEQAIAAFKKTLELNPKHTEAKQYLKDLQ